VHLDIYATAPADLWLLPEAHNIKKNESYQNLRGAVKKFPEMWYSTVMVGYMTTLYLITFKVGPLRTHTHTHTLAPSILPLLEAPVEGFVWNLLEFGRRIRSDVLHGCDTCPLEAHFKSRELTKVPRSEIRKVRWLGDDRNAFLSEKLPHNKRCVTRCLVVMQKPLSLPDVTLFSPNCMGQPPQNLHVEMTSVLSRPRSE